MQNEIISIIVPVYNVPHDMLKKCLTSLQHQTYKNLEIIVIDDGSTDLECIKICDSYKNKQNFKIYHKQNGGLCDARNYGVKVANGKWISFVDGDDYLNNDCIENVANKIINNEKIEIVCFGTTKEYKTSKFNYDYNNVFSENKIYSDNYELLRFLLDFKTNIGDATAKLYKRDFLNKNNIEHNIDIKQGVEAIDFNFKCFEKCNGLQFVRVFGYNYVYNDKSITLSISKKNIELLHKGINQLYLDLNNSQFSNSLKLFLDTRINYVVVTTAISGIFSPDNKLNKRDKKNMLEFFLDNKNISSALSNKKIILDFKRKIIIFLIKRKMCFLISFISKIRKIQKERF